eukprot:TRINITY_DN1979_c0_g1_i1.p1 TRINITY_DN1979_c0_g1~~TRINITY_DN1979_c0_g1_i1.p1  ORF type:complete len:101 (-),score=22.58 TRINITY_DN1979_c0_g1_i1:292-594(-)
MPQPVALLLMCGTEEQRKKMSLHCESGAGSETNSKLATHVYNSQRYHRLLIVKLCVRKGQSSLMPLARKLLLLLLLRCCRCHCWWFARQHQQLGEPRTDV